MTHNSSAWREAELFRQQQRWDEADTAFRDAVAQAAYPEIFVAYGTYLAERQAIQPAITYLMRGLDGAQTTGNLELQAVVFNNLAVLYRELGDHHQAQKFQRQVLSIQGDADPGDLIHWSMDALLAGKTALAESIAQQAFHLMGDSDEIESQADLFGSMGAIAATRGKPQRAIKLLIRAARGHQFAGDHRGLGADYSNLAEVCGLIGRYAWQRMFLESAGNCFQRAGMPVSHGRVQERMQDAGRLERSRQAEVRWN